MEKFLASLDQLIQHISFKRVFAFLLLMIIAMASLAVYENRQRMYSSVISRTEGDYVLEKPTDAGKKIMQDLLVKYPNIAMITLIDADPVGNRRIAVDRVFNSKELEAIMLNTLRTNPTAGDSVLFSSNEQSNKEVLAVMTGEFLCTANKGTILTNNFQGSDQVVAATCRVPLPPAFNKATGWFAIHLKEWPYDRADELKVDALSMSLNYYNTEILKQGAVLQ